jgi:hypothetical protein
MVGSPGFRDHPADRRHHRRAGLGLASGTLANTAVVPGSCTSANINIDAKGRITAASNGIGPGGVTMNVIILQGNSIGTYSAPGLTSANKLLCVGRRATI